jgi:hypothetical protein
MEDVLEIWLSHADGIGGNIDPCSEDEVTTPRALVVDLGSEEIGSFHD